MPKDRRRTRSISSHPINSIYRILSQELGLQYLTEHEKFEAPIDNNFQSLVDSITHFVKVPYRIEKFMSFGLLYCLNNFLVAFTVLPLQLAICVAQASMLVRKQFLPNQHHQIMGISVGNVSMKQFFYFSYNPVIQASLLIWSAWLISNIDTSKMYHDVRRQSAIKLYVMIGVLDVVDKLVSTLGEDLLKFLMNLQFPLASMMARGKHERTPWYTLLMFFGSFILSLVYLVAHSICLIYQTISLNVAINSYSNALFTLLLSSQFSEIKSTVFKKFDRPGLFQNICSDLTERFQLLVYLFLIGLRNLIEIDANEGIIPSFWKSSIGSSLGGITSFKFASAFLNPTIIVIGSELLVDWLKHSYIAKYNHFSPKIYERFFNVLSNDFLEMNHEEFGSMSVEQSIFKRINSNRNLQYRIGLPVLVLNLVVVKMSGPSFRHFFYDKSSSEAWTDALNPAMIHFLIFIILVTVKLILSSALLKISTRRRNNYLIHRKKWESEQRQRRSPTKQQFQRSKETSQSVEKENEVSKDYKSGYFCTVGTGILEKNDMKYLFDEPEKSVSIDEMRTKSDRGLKDDGEAGLGGVVRYKMSSKRIW